MSIWHQKNLNPCHLALLALEKKKANGYKHLRPTTVGGVSWT